MKELKLFLVTTIKKALIIVATGILCTLAVILFLITGAIAALAVPSAWLLTVVLFLLYILADVALDKLD